MACLNCPCERILVLRALQKIVIPPQARKPLAKARRFVAYKMISPINPDPGSLWSLLMVLITERKHGMIEAS